MPLSALGLVILAAFIHASWNLVAKRAAHVGAAFVFAYTLLGAALYLPWLVWEIVHTPITWDGPVLVCIALSGLIHLAYSLCLQRGYRVADLSVVYPVARGTGPLWSSCAAILLLGEPATPTGLSGIACVVGGILLIATQGQWQRFREFSASNTISAGVRWGLLTGLLIASYTIVDAYGVKVLLIAPVILDWCANAVRFGMLIPWAIPQRQSIRQAMRGHWHLAFAVALLAPLSYILVLAALGLGGPVSLVAPAREMSMMVGALLGMIILREAVNGWRLLGCGLLMVGVILLGVG
ncbi:DMT family transporter [Parvibium lacunae]|uniref:Multidrug DMT transporter permease n=1 Tax=Parvibium lacunae TaxID=1888893 RepID=A0A368L6G7_9BURK|nr:DMT family transporter [Parvibium lacunae]RCS59255.1 multidrug DMT transporter permease [Parvibium lacunae]